VDSGNERIAGLYDPFHPAVLRLMRHAIEAARAAAKPVSLCGELAGDERATAILLGLGLRAFSVSPARIPRIKRLVLRTVLTEAESLAEAALQCSTGQQVRNLVVAGWSV
jgi:phosphotransferase system enzyme I (PtsI)